MSVLLHGCSAIHGFSSVCLLVDVWQMCWKCVQKWGYFNNFSAKMCSKRYKNLKTNSLGCVRPLLNRHVGHTYNGIGIRERGVSVEVHGQRIWVEDARRNEARGGNEDNPRGGGGRYSASDTIKCYIHTLTSLFLPTIYRSIYVIIIISFISTYLYPVII